MARNIHSGNQTAKSAANTGANVATIHSWTEKINGGVHKNSAANSAPTANPTRAPAVLCRELGWTFGGNGWSRSRMGVGLG